MDQPDWDRPLNEIETLWSDILRAHAVEGQGDAHEARVRLVLRYMGAVWRYLTWVLRDRDAADELAQEFAVRVLRGDFRQADPSRGRFRDFVRAAASNLVRDYYRRRKVRPTTGAVELPDPVAPQETSEEADAEFLKSWRMELFNRAKSALVEYQERTGRPYHDILTLRTNHPDLTSVEMASLYSTTSGKPVTDVWFRQNLRRARMCLSDLLLDEVAASLTDPTYEELEQEVIILDMFAYCRDSLRRRARRA